MICGRKSGISLLLVLLVLGLPCLPLFSDVVLTDEEYQELMTLIDESIAEQDALRIDLKLSQQESKNVKEDLNEVKRDNEALLNEVLTLRINSQLREESSKERERAARKKQIESFFWGFATGALSGGYGGYRIRDGM